MLRGAQKRTNETQNSVIERFAASPTAPAH
jgi:hypothetical protein